MAADAVANILVLVVDRLNAGFLGPYGNTWLPTPFANRLAGQSELLEFAFTTSPDLNDVYRSYWQGLHPLTPDQHAGQPLPLLWRQSGRATLLVTDEAEIADLPLSGEFSRQAIVEHEPVHQPAPSVDQTRLAALVDAAVAQLQNLREPFALWLHAQPLAAAWDAPLSLRELVRDEDDPPPSDLVQPPRLQLPDDADPDELTALAQAYAAQVMVVDECLDGLVSAVDNANLQHPTLVVLTSARGYLLGQQRQVGGDFLLEDLLHVPFLIRHPHAAHAAERNLSLAEPSDLYHFLARGADTPRPRQQILSVAAPVGVADASPFRERVFRTPAWMLRQLGADASQPERLELYAKPDDRYEVNNVAHRCAYVVEPLLAAANLAHDTLAAGHDDLTPLPDDLVSPDR